MSAAPVWSILPLGALGDLRAEWKALAAAAIDPNPFYEPDFLLAAQALGEASRISVLIARDPSGSGPLRALIPLRRPGWRQGWLRTACASTSSPRPSAPSNASSWPFRA